MDTVSRSSHAVRASPTAVREAGPTKVMRRREIASEVVDTQEDAEVARPDRSARLGLLLVIGVILAFVVAAWTRRWVTEDAFIDFRIVGNLLSGHGPVFNPGERVEAGTSPLWLLLLSAARVVTLQRIDLGWLAVGLGLVLTTWGLVAGVLGARFVGGTGSRPATRMWPAGLLVVAALPPMWDFATSGLEPSLIFAWLGTCFWLETRRAVRRPFGPAWQPVALLLLLSLGPLIRPDLGLFTVGFLAMHVACSRPGWKGRIGAVATTAALPVVSQVARMAYFAALVPNTALAKEASEADWSRGWTYLVDFVRPYGLLLVVALVAVLVAALPWSRWHDDHDRGRVWAVATPMVTGAISCLYVVRLGGDFMHARLLLPGLFSLLLPLFVWSPSEVRAGISSRLPRVVLVLLAVWAVATAATLRVPYAGGISADSKIADERGFWADSAGTANPVTVDDYRNSSFAQLGALARERSDAGADVLILGFGTESDGTELPLPPGSGVVLVVDHIGIDSVMAGDDVVVVDPHGLSDAFAARIELVTRGRPGHEKSLPDAWILARYGIETDRPDVVAAAAALACPTPSDLQAAITDPLSVSRLLHNIASSPRLTTWRFPADPTQAPQCPP